MAKKGRKKLMMIKLFKRREENMKKIILLSLIATSSQAYYLGHYIKQLQLTCKNVKSLAVKKSVIALTKSKENTCMDVYSKLVIKTCENKIACKDLYSLLEESKSTYSGNVLGQ